MTRFKAGLGPLLLCILFVLPSTPAGAQEATTLYVEMEVFPGTEALDEDEKLVAVHLQVAGHGGAHDSEADKTDLAHCLCPPFEKILVFGPAPAPGGLPGRVIEPQ